MLPLQVDGLPACALVLQWGLGQPGALVPPLLNGDWATCWCPGWGAGAGAGAYRSLPLSWSFGQARESIVFCLFVSCVCLSAVLGYGPLQHQAGYIVGKKQARGTPPVVILQVLSSLLNNFQGV